MSGQKNREIFDRRSSDSVKPILLYLLVIENHTVCLNHSIDMGGHAKKE